MTSGWYNTVEIREDFMFVKKIMMILVSMGLAFQVTGAIDLHQTQDQLAKIAKDVIPAVVNISTVKVVKQKQAYPYTDPFFDDVFRDFFGDEFFRHFSPRNPQGRDFKQRSLGSGVIVSKKGYILTNHHVVDGADEIKVILSDKREFTGKIIGTDSKTDVAVIKIKANGLPVAILGDSDQLEVGHWAMAVGNPFGLSRTITLGIISAKGRANIGIVDYENFIQTDAAINPGNSGGALVNINGEVIGINTAIFSRSGGYQGIGFAIPINLAKQVMAALIGGGKVTRGWLGVVIQPITEDLRKQFRLDSKSGVLIGDVAPDSPAAKAGIRRGDVIVKFADKDIEDVFQLRNTVASTPIGKVVKIHVKRRGKSRVFKVKIGELPESSATSEKTRKDITGKVGMSVQELTPDLAQRFGYRGDKGVVVMNVELGAPAQGAGIRSGDLIKEINRKPIRNLNDYTRVVSSLKAKSDILFLIRRGQYTQYVVVRVE